MVRSIFIILSLAFSSSPGFASENPCQKVTSYVQKALHMSCAKGQPSFESLDNPTTSIFITLKAQADLGLGALYSDLVDRRRFVVGSLKEIALRTQAPIRQMLDEEGIAYTPYYIHNMIRIDQANAAVVLAAASRDDVAKVFGNPKFQLVEMGRLRGFAIAEEGPSATGVEPNIESTGATRVWNELKVKGKGITVAGQDTGVQFDHPALARQYRGNKNGVVDHNYNWFDAIKSGSNTNPCGFNTQAPCDDDQHGTHTMGTMLGDDGGANKTGMAPEANWIACRNMNAGNGSPGSYIDCFQFFLAPYPLHGDAFKDGNPQLAPNVMNNSWGCPTEEGCSGSEMIDVLKALEAAGIFVVASAGNDGPNCFTIHDQPAQISDFTFSVGAHNHRDGLIASFSSRGPSALDQKLGPDVTAPGVSIRSSIPGSSYQGGFWSGTSMAGPHVVGLVALLWSANPQLIGDIAATSELIRKTAVPATAPEQTCGGVPGTSIPNNTYGYGRIDAFKAVSQAISLVHSL